MTEVNPDQITGTIAITVLPQDDDSMFARCHCLSAIAPEMTPCASGQTKEHAIAIALEEMLGCYVSVYGGTWKSEK